MSRSWARPLAGVFLLALGCGSPSPTNSPVVAVAPAPPIAGKAHANKAAGRKTYPLPPQQKAPWNAPDNQLPKPLISAAEALHRHGLADPRGCEYREITVVTGNVWRRDDKPFKTHGWVIPGAGQQRYAVALNGLVYRTVSVGAAADIKADVAQMLEQRAKSKNPYGSDNRERFWLSHQQPSLTKVLLLLRRNEIKLAETLWNHWTSEYKTLPFLKQDPYPTLAAEWTWLALDRTVCAHMRRDDELVWQGLAQLDGLLETVVNTATQRNHIDAAIREQLKFLEIVAPLKADHQRRRAANNNSDRSHDVTALRKLPEAQRIQALIERLDEVDVRQQGQPGGVRLRKDGLVVELIEVGEPAVDALIDVLEKDARLTRSVSFWRDFSRQRSLVEVHFAAMAALSAILGPSFFELIEVPINPSLQTVQQRRALATKMRAHWNRWQAMSKQRRLLESLAKDAAKPPRWLASAKQITTPKSLPKPPKDKRQSRWAQTIALAQHRQLDLHGESLRKLSKPSITDLLIRRVHELSNIDQGCLMAEALVRWDIKASGASLRKQMGRALAAASAIPKSLAYSRCIARLTLARSAIGDTAAIIEYANWLATTSPAGRSSMPPLQLFEPLWRNPKNAAVMRAARQLFLRKSEWAPLLPTRNTGDAYWDFGDLIASPLLAVVPFKQHLTAALTNRLKIGKVTLDSEHEYSIQFEDSWGVTNAIAAKDTDAAAKGSSHPISAAEFYAWKFSDYPGAPPFQPYWKAAKRAAALKASATWLRRHHP